MKAFLLNTVEDSFCANIFIVCIFVRNYEIPLIKIVHIQIFFISYVFFVLNNCKSEMASIRLKIDVLEIR